MINLRSRKIIGPFLSAIVLAAGFYTYQLLQPVQVVETEANTYQFKSVDDLEEKADLIVQGEVSKDFEEYEPTIYRTDHGTFEQFYTIVEFKAKKVFKGENLDTVPVIENAALVNEFGQKTLYVHDGYTTMEKGIQYLLFLKKNDFDEGYWIMSITQGKFNEDNLDENEKSLVRNDDHFKNLKDEVLDKYKTKLAK